MTAKSVVMVNRDLNHIVNNDSQFKGHNYLFHYATVDQETK